MRTRPNPTQKFFERLASTSVSAMLAAAGLIAATAGCDSSNKEEIRAAAAAEAKRKSGIIERLSPSVKAKVSQATKLDAALRTTPPAAPDQKPPAVTPPIKLKTLHYDDADSNADMLFDNELALFQRGILGSCDYNLRTGFDDQPSISVEKSLTGCTKIRYFLVVRPASKVKAQEASLNGYYQGGEIRGDVVLFELPEEGPAKVLGAFPIEVALTKTVKVRAEASRDSVEYELNEALRNELLLAIEKKLGG